MASSEVCEIAFACSSKWCLPRQIRYAIAQLHVHPFCAAQALRKRSDEELAELYAAEEQRTETEAFALHNGSIAAGEKTDSLLAEVELGGVEAVLRQQRVGLLERLTRVEQRAKLYEGSFEVERMRVASLRTELSEQKSQVYVLLPSALFTFVWHPADFKPKVNHDSFASRYICIADVSWLIWTACCSRSPLIPRANDTSTRCKNFKKKLPKHGCSTSVEQSTPKREWHRCCCLFLRDKID